MAPCRRVAVNHCNFVSNRFHRHASFSPSPIGASEFRIFSSNRDSNGRSVALVYQQNISGMTK